MADISRQIKQNEAKLLDIKKEQSSVTEGIFNFSQTLKKAQQRLEENARVSNNSSDRINKKDLADDQSFAHEVASKLRGYEAEITSAFTRERRLLKTENDELRRQKIESENEEITDGD
ncbi:hypothetical protein [Pseudolactococcus reticulitermitis]|uniref:Uncharacterized protein n=1 Tax=Pseudolactococcus reticulitermitis TaxID=2025039 RepID=A0A224XAN1_9LACT|nr:hypothetical protein [Lactococcus reticulitermitis]GAX48320.1 hypothetical protein RsY01_1936 [Lactococcus reticulitermitis]